MNYINYIKTIFMIFVCVITFTTANISVNKVTAEPVPITQAHTQDTNAILPLSVVNNPKYYLNKAIILKATFDKFSTLGLDYKPAFRSSEDYISFLVKRDDTIYDIPLSELKIFLKRDVAEKFIDLKTNDKIRIKGKVFSDALGDAWMDAEEITIIQKAPDKTGTN